MKITKRQLRKIIKEAVAGQMGHGTEPLAGDNASNPNSNYWKPVRTPEAVEAFKAAGFTSDGKMADRSKGLGVLEMGMFVPENQQEVDAAIKAALEINKAIIEADKALSARKYRRARDAYNKIVAPVQRRHGRTGADETEGTEKVASWFEDYRRWDWY